AIHVSCSITIKLTLSSSSSCHHHPLPAS
ncbi:hypothetical protein PanWU01x14_358360, partial [Parasponia andersonii]